MVSSFRRAGQVLQFRQDFIRDTGSGGGASFCQNEPAGFLGGIPVLRLRLGRHLESAEVINVSSRLISNEIIFRSRLTDILKEKLNLAAIVSKVTQAADVVQ